MDCLRVYIPALRLRAPIGWRVAGMLLLVGGVRPVFAQIADMTGGDRLVHHFDFDERDDGNLERVPKFWRRFNSPGFPRYSEGFFDRDAGHDAPPSFRLDAQGKNVAYRYAGREIPANDANDYLVDAWIRTDRFVRARAAISVYYLDHDGLPLAATQRFSELVGASDPQNPWRRVRVFLPSGPEDAKWVGLTVWVVHPDVWDMRPRPRRSIERKDVTASAAFDDIRIYRLPRVAIETPAPSNVFGPDTDASISVEVTDADTLDLTARLDVYDVDDRILLSTTVPVRSQRVSTPMVVDLNGLPNGLFWARVTVETPQGLLTERTLRFAALRSELGGGHGGARGFGVELDVSDRTDPMIELAMLRTLNVGAVKIPIWSGRAFVPDFMDAVESSDALLYELLKSRVDVTGVFAGPPAQLVRDAGAYPRPLLAMLTGDPNVWREHLVRVFAPYASIFRSWQLGLDGDPAIIGNPNLVPAIRQVRAEIEKLITSPHISVPASFSLEPDDPPPPADGLSFVIDAAIVPSAIRSHVEGFRARGLPVDTAFVELPDDTGVERRSHLRDWCKRLIHTRHAGVSTVVVPQLWHSRTVSDHLVTEPTEELVVVHTLTQLLGDTTPGSAIYVAPGVTALSFNGLSGTVLAMWDGEAGVGAGGETEYREHDIHLGAADRQIDMWGRVTPLTRLEDGRQRIRLGADPIFIDGVDRWLVDFRTMVSLTPDFIELSVDAHRHELTIVNPHDQPLGIQMRLRGPQRWDVNPRRFKFALSPGEKVVKTFDIRYGRDMVAETKVLNVEFELDTQEHYKLNVPIAVQAGVRDLDAWGHAVVSGDRLIVRHRVFNRSDQTLNLRAFVVAPGRARQTRFLTEFLPGQTTTLEYHFKDYESLIGRKLRLHLRELNGPRIHNIEIDVR